MELKTCKRCGKEKTIDEYRRSGKKSDGSIYYRATCKVCDLELEHKRKEEKGIIVKSTKHVDKQPEPVHGVVKGKLPCTAIWLEIYYMTAPNL